MSEIFKCHANGLAILSDGNETHLLFLLKRPTVNAELEPIPLLAGISPSCIIVIPYSIFIYFNVAFTEGCMIWSIEVTVSCFE